LALVWLASQSQVVPYVVRVDEAGQSLVIGPAQASQATDPRIVGWQLQGFVRQVRQVTADRTAQKQLLDRAYQQAAGPAIAFLNAHFRDEATNPFVRSRTEIVMPSVRNTLQIGERTWEVEWVEAKHTLEGKDAGRETWKGQFEVRIDPPSTPEDIVANPLGFKVTRISWSRTF
jgi:type IV secretory pathway TrbF-like protein